jgi:hypothetical protein
MQPLEKIENWLTEIGYTLKWGKTDICDRRINQITITSSLTGNNKLFSILHECGHAILFTTHGYNVQFKSLVIARRHDGRHAKSLIYKYKKIKEEIDAWEEGYKLAKKLKIRINKKEYDKYAARWVHTYIQALAETHPGTWDVEM